MFPLCEMVYAADKSMRNVEIANMMMRAHNIRFISKKKHDGTVPTGSPFFPTHCVRPFGSAVLCSLMVALSEYVRCMAMEVGMAATFSLTEVSISLSPVSELLADIVLPTTSQAVEPYPFLQFF